MSSPASKSPELSDKSKKYDRQIRLWGEHGQNFLENANICLINATGLGSEILKSLVLPGIGGFTIVDASHILEEDIGCNFFLPPNSHGLPKGKCCMELLRELNPDVNGDYIDESVEIMLATRPDFFETFDVVIASNITEKTLMDLSRKLWDLNIPLFYCRSVGMFGSIRLQIKEHCVIESHPDNRQFDLRLENPFPALEQHLNATDLTNKVPWLTVLYKYLKIWTEKSGKTSPTTYKEKSELRDLIKSGMKGEEENFEEAIKAVNSSFGGGKPSTYLQSFLEDECCTNLNKTSTTFWILVRALRDFMKSDNNNYLPLPGTLPDMTADTESYINLQNVYRQQAMQDADNVYRRCQEILKELALSKELITEKCVRIFCREASGIAVIRGSKIEDEHEKTTKITTTIGQGLEVPNSLMEHYVVLRANEKFQTEYGTIPGEWDVEVDTARLKTIVGKLIGEWGIHTPISDDLIHEICRYGGAEIHSVSAFIGGCVAHEVIKVITKQYKPIDNTFMYNAITSETGVFKF